MQVYVIRHTEVDIPQDLCYGYLDVPLKENFLEDFEDLKSKLPSHFDEVFTSPSKRCLDLANFISPKITKIEALREMNFGDWEGKLWQNIPEEESKYWTNDIINEKTPNGESLKEMYVRVHDFINELRTKNSENVLLVTHSGIIRILFSLILNIPLLDIFKLKIGYQSVYQFRISENVKEDFWCF